MENKNFALQSNGATVVDVSHEAQHVASSANNLLTERQDQLWITGDAPQHVTIRIAPNHPPLRYVGWHVWHDYLSNPQSVEVSSGVVPDCFVPLTICNAVAGSGTQLWELPEPIPSSHTYVRFRILSSFARGPTYMNHLVLLASNPESYARDPSPAPAGPSSNEHRASTAIEQPMSALLRELDEDIRALQPIRTVSPSKSNMIYMPGPSLPSLVEQQITELVKQPLPPAAPEVSVSRSPLQAVDNTAFRLSALEQAVASLTRTLDHQRADIAAIKELVAERRSSSKPKKAPTPEAVHVEFPEQMLRTFVEDVLAPKLQKYATRLETRTMEHVEGQLQGLLENLAETVDERVRGYVRHYQHEHSHSNNNNNNSSHHHHQRGDLNQSHERFRREDHLNNFGYTSHNQSRQSMSQESRSYSRK